MNREIKFRSYHKKYGSHDGMQEVTSLFPRRKAVMCTNWRCKFEDIELMQYTGLKDKNGVEIYEGDIVKSIIQRDFDEVREIIGTVVYVDGEASYKVITKNDDEYTLGWLDDLQVIGNIYENPELLEGR